MGGCHRWNRQLAGRPLCFQNAYVLGPGAVMERILMNGPFELKKHRGLL